MFRMPTSKIFARSTYPRLRSGPIGVLVSSTLILGVLAIVPAGVADTAKPGTVKIAAVVSMSVAPDTNGVLVSGQLIVLSGKVTSSGKSGPIPTGIVHVLINGLASKDGPTVALDSAGRFTLPEFSLPVLLNLTEPVYPIAVSVAYDGDDIFAAGFGSAIKMSAFASNTVTMLTSNESPSPYGKDATFHVQVSSVAGLGKPSGFVMFGANGIAAGGTVPIDSKGGADWTTSMTLGKHLVTATYLPTSGEFRTSQAKLTQIVLPPTSKVQAHLTVDSVPLKNSRVGFRFSGELQPPVGLPEKEACTGTVKLILAQGQNKITTATSVGGNCRYDVSISFPASAKIQPELEINATATFSGNPLIQASPEPIQMPLYGGRSPSLHSKLPVSSACQNWHLGCRVIPWIVVLGDSYMAGEGGRWAGNTNLPGVPPLPILTDALGANAYRDNLTNNINFPGPNGAPVAGTNEIIPGCHRSRVDEAFIGGPKGLDLACSGAQTSSFSTTWTGPVLAKPGIDFESWGGNKGQALLLSDFASVPSRKVKMVVLGIGGNDYGFGDILATCASDYLTSENRTTQSSHSQWYYNNWHDWGWTQVDDAPVDHRTYCSDDPTLTDRFSPAHVAAIESKVTIAITNVARALASQGYGRNDYTIMVQLAPLPVANSASMRYGQGATFSWLQPSTWLDKPRQSLGGCGFWDRDVNWMTSFVMGKFNATTWQAVQDSRNINVTGPGGVGYKPRIELLDVGNAFQGHLLCEGATSGGPNPDVLTSSWSAAGSINISEWITQLRILPNFIGELSSYALQEGFHPNYWGHLALRACLRLAYNNGNPKSGKCAPLTGSAGLGLNTTHSPAEPKMGLS